MVTSEDEFSRLRKILKEGTRFYFNVVKLQLFDEFTISPNNSYLSNTIQVLSIIWAILGNNTQYVTIIHNKTQ